VVGGGELQRCTFKAVLALLPPEGTREVHLAAVGVPWGRLSASTRQRHVQLLIGERHRVLGVLVGVDVGVDEHYAVRIADQVARALSADPLRVATPPWIAPQLPLGWPQLPLGWRCQRPGGSYSPRSSPKCHSALPIDDLTSTQPTVATALIQCRILVNQA
jgi:hypothetical protein